MSRKMKKKNNIIKKVKYAGITSVCLATFLFAAKVGLLDDGPTQYSIPENAISGGIVEVRGKTYERFQLNGKYFLLDLSTGAEIPQ